MKNYVRVYCDFDGTITKKDTVNAFLEKYADKKWLDIEEMWNQHKIGARECLEKQVAVLPSMTERELNEFISSIEIDDYFIEFYKYLNSKNIELVILSDGFDLFINRVLENNGLNNINYYANTLIFKDNHFSIEFNNYNSKCNIQAGSCKCSKISEKDYCYIGDGQSDSCVAQKASTLFAKGNLKSICDAKGINYYSFTTFKDIIDLWSRGEFHATSYAIN